MALSTAFAEFDIEISPFFSLKYFFYVTKNILLLSVRSLSILYPPAVKMGRNVRPTH